ncbi:MAG: four helix bundle protein [Chitinophagaceae bacterium]
MKKELFDNNPILKLSFDFSILIIDYCEQLEFQKKFVIARQLLKSGTSIGANSMEAQNAESRADFIHKMKIAAKEAEETQYWLWLCDYSKNYPDCKELLSKLEEINKVLGSILKTAKKTTVVLSH